MTASLKPLIIKLLRSVLLIALFMLMAGIGTYLTLTLMIKNQDTVIVPDLVGKDVLIGLEMLSDLGLNTRVKGIRYDEHVPQHHVIEQDPQPGSAIKRGRDVKIQVSRGPESIAMPNLSGLSLQQSRILLMENGLCQGVVSRMHSSLYNVDQVMAHHPRPRATVNRKMCVDLLVSQGPAPVSISMLDLKGLGLETAIHQIEQFQLDVGYIQNVHVPDGPLETIVTQVPQAGYRVSVGSPVDLTVNRFSSTGSIGNPKTVNAVGLFHFKLENGFLNQHVEVKLSQPQLLLSLFDDFMHPGQEIWLLIPKSDNPTVLVYVDGQLVDSRILNDR